MLKQLTVIFLISVYGLHAKGIQSPNVMIGMLVFLGGICQFIAGIMEFITGNTVRLIRFLVALSSTKYRLY